MLKKVKPLVLWALLCASTAVKAQAPAVVEGHDMNYYISHAPFKMAAIPEPHFNNKTYNITEYGAVGNGQQLNTDAINKAITTCSNSGGGTVIIPTGLWLTGPIELKSNVNLHAQRGALIVFSPNHSLYAVQAGGKVQNPIYGNKLENIALTGGGIYDGAGDTWRPLKKTKAAPTLWSGLVKSGGKVSADGNMWWPTQQGMEGEDYIKSLKKKGNVTTDDYLPARDFLRPNLVVINNSKNVLIDGPTFKNSPKFVLNPGNCTNLIIRNVTINNEYYAQNGDGIDLSACKNAIVYRCTVNAGDDGICMKSSGGSKSAAGPGLENIVIADCIVYHAHGGFVIGSNTDGGMNNIYVTNCNYVNTDIGIRVKSNSGRGGLVQNVFIDNIFMYDILEEAVLFDTYYEDNANSLTRSQGTNGLTPHFQDFFISNVYCNGAKTAISITGLPEMPISRIKFTNCVIAADEGLTAKDASDITLNNVSIVSPASTLIKLDNTSNLTLNQFTFGPKTQTLIEANGAKTTGIKLIKTNTKTLNNAFKGLGKNALTIN